MSLVEKLLLILKKSYAQSVPIRLLEQEASSLLGLDTLCELALLQIQESLAQSTFAHPIRSVYPEAKSYRYQFIKWIVGLVEPYAGEDGVSDLLLNALVDCVSSPVDEGTGWYIYFTTPNLTFEDGLVIREDRKIIVEGTTGLRCWKAGIVLSQWLLTSEDVDLKSKHILELGCGLGLVGLSAAIDRVGALSVTFTDCHPTVIGRVQENVRANRDRGLVTKCVTKVRFLDWTSAELSREIAELDHFDVILAADVTYDPDLLPAFCDTVLCLLRTAKESICIVSLTMRNPTTFQAFLQQLESHHLQAEDVIFPEELQLHATSEPGEVRIMRLSLAVT